MAEDSSQQKQKKRQQKCAGYQVTGGGRKFVLLNHPHLPIAVLHVLPEQRRQRPTRPIPASKLRALVDPASTPADSQVVLVILVPHQLLIKISKTLESYLAPAAKIDCIHRTFVVCVVSAGASDSERRLKCGSDGAANVTVPCSQPRSSHVVRSCLFQHLEATSHVIRGVSRVSIHPDDNLPARGANRRIQTD